MEDYAARLRPYVDDHVALVDRALKEGPARAPRRRAGHPARPRPRHLPVRHLVEPDRRHGPRPASASARPASTASWASRRRMSRASARAPFPTEIEGLTRARVRELDAEYGTTTDRERRCGWLDLVALRFAVPRERDDEPGADEDRRPLRFPGAPRVRALPATTAPRPKSSPLHRATSTTPSPSTRRWPAGRKPGRGRVARRPADGGARPHLLRRGAARDRGLPHLRRRRARAIRPREPASVAG